MNSEISSFMDIGKIGLEYLPDVQYIMIENNDIDKDLPIDFISLYTNEGKMYTYMVNKNLTVSNGNYIIKLNVPLNVRELFINCDMEYKNKYFLTKKNIRVLIRNSLGGIIFNSNEILKPIKINNIKFYTMRERDLTQFKNYYEGCSLSKKKQILSKIKRDELHDHILWKNLHDDLS